MHSTPKASHRPRPKLTDANKFMSALSNPNLGGSIREMFSARGRDEASSRRGGRRKLLSNSSSGSGNHLRTTNTPNSSKKKGVSLGNLGLYRTNTGPDSYSSSAAAAPARNSVSARNLLIPPLLHLRRNGDQEQEEKEQYQNPHSSPTKQRDQQDGTTACSIFASNIMSVDSIVSGLKDVKRDIDIVKVDFEDLVTNTRHEQILLPLVKALMACGGRTWERFRFVDSLSAEDFVTWQQRKDAMMQDYEQMAFEIYRGSDVVDVISWRANINIHRGTHRNDILSFLRTLREDVDLYSLQFSGALQGYYDVFVPDEFENLIDSDSQTLKEDVIVETTCGWLDDNENEWLVLMNNCITALEGTKYTSNPKTKKDKPKKGNNDKKTDSATNMRKLDESWQSTGTVTCSLLDEDSLSQQIPRAA